MQHRNVELCSVFVLATRLYTNIRRDANKRDSGEAYFITDPSGTQRCSKAITGSCAAQHPQNMIVIQPINPHSEIRMVFWRRFQAPFQTASTLK